MGSNEEWPIQTHVDYQGLDVTRPGGDAGPVRSELSLIPQRLPYGPRRASRCSRANELISSSDDAATWDNAD